MLSRWSFALADQVNLPYILWVAGYNASFTLAYILILDVGFFPGVKPRKSPNHIKSPTIPSSASFDGATRFDTYPEHCATLDGNPPVLLERINKHGLALFLIVSKASLF